LCANWSSTKLSRRPHEQVQGRDRHRGSDGSIAFDVPHRLTKRGYRKLVQLTGPEAAERPWDAQPAALQRALGRAERWHRMLQSGEATSVNDLATKRTRISATSPGYSTSRRWRRSLLRQY